MLEDLRKKINEIDQKILHLLQERASVALKIYQEKKGKKVPIYQPQREQEILEKLKEVPGPLSSKELSAIYREIMSATLHVEKNLKIAYLGPEGSFTHEAALKRFGSSLEYLPQEKAEDVFLKVYHQEASYGVLPIENSQEGIVHEVLDLLIEYPLKIYAEVFLSIHHFLYSFAKNLQEIQTIYSHYKAFEQCKSWLKKHLPGAKWEYVPSTSYGVKKLLEKKDPSIGAIGSPSIEKIYSIPPVAKYLEETKENYTRFLVLSTQEGEPAKKSRTSILFSLPHRPGSLYEALKILAQHKINLTFIESRPLKGTPWHYLFYMDMEGDYRKEPLKKALEELRNYTPFLKILGSYPIDITYNYSL